MTPLWSYVLADSVWTLLGFVLGTLFGWIVRDVRRIADAVTEEDTVPARTLWKRPSGQALLGAIVFALGIATVVQGLYQNASIRRVSDCQTAYTTGFADALDARSSAAASAQDSLDTLMTKVGDVFQHSTADSRATVQQAVDDYLAARSKAKATASKNPYPPAPRDLCK